MMDNKDHTTEALPPNERKKDLIDLVREGHQIDIYEDTPLLKEGDVLQDWEKSQSNKTKRQLVGEKVRPVLGLFGEDLCEWCETPRHFIVEEIKTSFIGRNEKTYYKMYRDEERGKVCPRCGDSLEFYRGRY